MLRCKIATFGIAAILLLGKWEEPLADPAALQGEWEILSVERQGFPDSAPVGHTVRITGNEVHFEALHGALTTVQSFHDANRRIPS